MSGNRNVTKQLAMICSTGFESEMTAQLGIETGFPLSGGKGYIGEARARSIFNGDFKTA